MAIDPKMLSDEIILIGDDAEAFFKTNIGKYVISKAEAEVQEAMFSLTTVDPNNAAEISKLQGSIEIAKKTLLWLNEAITTGKQELQNRMSVDDIGK